jgi:tetratricopeptide (TPR) repeat protein
MRVPRREFLALAGIALACPAWALDATGTAALLRLQQRWAEIQYRLPQAQREAGFAALDAEAERAVAAQPGTAELLIWRGIIQGSWAGARGGLGALGLVRQAKASLEAAIEIDPRALDGAAYTSLGTLYYLVPGWPVGFGNNARAEELLRMALRLNPNGIDPNYFYGDFLLRQSRYTDARQALQKALAAPPRAGRELADEGRRGEIRQRIQEIGQRTG